MFFFIPIGHEDSKIRRFPAACFGVILICLFGFALSWPRYQEEASRLQDTFYAVMKDYARVTASGSEDYEEYQEGIKQFPGGSNPVEFLDSAEAALEKYSNQADDDDLERLKKDIEEARELLSSGVFFSYGLVAKSPSPLAFLTHMFLHGGFGHLISNLVFLILVGPSLEELWGRTVFAFAYLFSGLTAAIGYMLVNLSSPVPMIGASGAIAGLMGAFLMTFTYTRINFVGFWFFFYRFRVVHFSTPAWVFFPIWIGMELLQGLLQLGLGNVNTGGVAHWAHIAGFFFGLAIPWLLRVSGMEQKLFPAFARDSQGKEVLVASAGTEYLRTAEYRKADRLRKEGDLAGAETCFQALLEQNPKCLGLRLEIIDFCRLSADQEKLRKHLLGALDLAIKEEDPRMLGIFETLRLEFPREEVAPEVLFRIGTAFDRAGKSVDALDCLQKFVKNAPEHPLWIRGALRLANLLSGPMKNPAAARDLLQKARETAADQVWKVKVDRQLKALEASPKDIGAAPGSPEKQVDRVGG